jgi:hypothetical protein
MEAIRSFVGVGSLTDNTDGSRLTPSPVEAPTEVFSNATSSGNSTTSDFWRFYVEAVKRSGNSWLNLFSQLTLSDAIPHLVAVFSVLLGVSLCGFVFYWLIYPKGFLVRFVNWSWHRVVTRWRRTVRAGPQLVKRVSARVKFEAEGPYVEMDLPTGTYQGIITYGEAALLKADVRTISDDRENSRQRSGGNGFENVAESPEMLVRGVVQIERGMHTDMPGTVTFRRSVDGPVFGEGSRATFGGSGTRLVTAYHVWEDIMSLPSVWIEHKGVMLELGETHKYKVSAKSPRFDVEKLRRGVPTGIDVAVVTLPDKVWSALGVKSLTPDFRGVAMKVGTVQGYTVGGKFATSVAKLMPTAFVDRYEHLGGTHEGWSGSPIIEARTGRLIAVHTGRKVTNDGNYASGLRPFVRLCPEESAVLSHDQWKRERELDAREAEAAYELQFNLDDARTLAPDVAERWDSEVIYSQGKSYNAVPKSYWVSTFKDGRPLWGDMVDEPESGLRSKRKSAFMKPRLCAAESQESGLSAMPEVSIQPKQDFRSGGGDSPTPPKAAVIPKKHVRIEVPLTEDATPAETQTTVQSPLRPPSVSDPQILELLKAMEKRQQRLEERTNRMLEEMSLLRKVPQSGTTTEQCSEPIPSLGGTSGNSTPRSLKQADSTSSEPGTPQSVLEAQGRNKKRRARRKENGLPNNSENMAGPNAAVPQKGKASSTKPANSEPAKDPVQEKSLGSSPESGALIQEVSSLLALLKGQSLVDLAETLRKGKTKLPESAL